MSGTSATLAARVPGAWTAVPGRRCRLSRAAASAPVARLLPTGPAEVGQQALGEELGGGAGALPGGGRPRHHGRRSRDDAGGPAAERASAGTEDRAEPCRSGTPARAPGPPAVQAAAPPT